MASLLAHELKEPAVRHPRRRAIAGARRLACRCGAGPSDP
jgi:hypothetical protein